MKQVKYPKVYGVITEINYVCYKPLRNYVKKEQMFTPEQWAAEKHRHRYICKEMVITVVVETAKGKQEVVIDGFGYVGKSFAKVAVGRQVKLFKRSQDRRPFVYKLTGE